MTTRIGLVVLAAGAGILHTVPPVTGAVNPAAVFALPVTLGAWSGTDGISEWILPLDPSEQASVVHEEAWRRLSGRDALPVDGERFARRVIREGGYGNAFIHRLGHGIGMDGHEDPYLVADSPDTLSQGMAFSIEPGIYLQGKFGVRIEDIVVCGPTGPDVLNEATRELLVVDG